MENSDIVLTLDAGGTNFVFTAMRGKEFIVQPITKPSHSYDLDKCLNTLVEGFSEVKAKLSEDPIAISFAFPGPADYANGIIDGYLPSFPSFKYGVALGPFLKKKFNIPVFINNDGDLYAYGEAMMGKLPEVNAKLKAAGSIKQYKNLIGYTFGTGMGVGFVSDGVMHVGDNSCIETFCLPHKDNRDITVEDGVAIRAITRVYGELSGNPEHKLQPKDIFDIAEGSRKGDVEAAKAAFAKLGEVAGATMAETVNLYDGIIVIGGGLTGAMKYIMPSLLKEMRGTMHSLNGDVVQRVQMSVYNLDDEAEFKKFATGSKRSIKIPGYEEEITYDNERRIGVCTSTIGASAAISYGAQAYAMSQLGKK